MFIPYLVILGIILNYVEETPTYLLLQDEETALKAFNRMGKINYGEDFTFSLQDLNYFYSISKINRRKKEITIVHLLTLPSLKTKTLALCFVSIFMCFLYYGPIFIVNKMAINPYVSMILFSTV